MPNPDTVRSIDPERGDEIVDGTVVEPPLAPDPRPAPSQLLRRERRSEVLRPLDREQLVTSFREYQELCKQLLDDSDYQRDGNRKFKKKSAWRKLATAFDLDVELIREHVERDHNGTPVRAAVIARAIAPSGRFQDGDGYCSIDEPRFDKSGGRKKIENDLRTTATTRAKNRSISDLLGTGEVSAEEISGDGHEEGPPYGPEVAKGIAKNAGKAAVQLAGDDPHAGIALWKKITAHLGGYMPQAAAVALLAAAEALPRSNGSDGNAPATAHEQVAADSADAAREAEPAPQDPGADCGEVAQLEDEALRLWSQLVSEPQAVKKVSDAHGNVGVLRILIETAGRNLRQQEGAL